MEKPVKYTSNKLIGVVFIVVGITIVVFPFILNQQDTVYSPQDGPIVVF